VRRAALVALVLATAPPAASAAPTVTSGSLKATVHTNPWRVDYRAIGGRCASANTGPAPSTFR
jgi:hypothetical protein